jgi:hypothetical protein
MTESVQSDAPRSIFEELATIERGRIDLRAGAIGLGILAVVLAALGLIGAAAVAMAIGVLVVLVGPAPSSPSEWIRGLAVVGLGAALTVVAVAVGADAVPAAAFAALVGAASTLEAGRGRGAAVRAFLMTIWLVLALALVDTGTSELAYAVAFAAGCGIGAVGVTIGTRRASGPGGTREPATEPPPTFAALARSPLGLMAVLRGLGLGVAVLLGYAWFPEHSLWAAFTALIIIRPPTRRAVVVGLKRSIGTGAGVALAVLLAGLLGASTAAVAVLFLATAFLMMAIKETDYTIVSALVTALVVFGQRLVSLDAAEAGLERLLATLVGVAIAFVVLAAVEAAGRAHRPAA